MALQKEYESPISQLAEICATVSKMPGVIGIRVDRSTVLIQMRYKDFSSLPGNFTFKPFDHNFPMEASIQIEGVTFYTLVPRREWEHFCEANHRCLKCGAEQEEKPVENQLNGERARGWFCPNHCTDWIPVSA